MIKKIIIFLSFTLFSISCILTKTNTPYPHIFKIPNLWTKETINITSTSKTIEREYWKIKNISDSIFKISIVYKFKVASKNISPCIGLSEYNINAELIYKAKQINSTTFKIINRKILHSNTNCTSQIPDYNGFTLKVLTKNRLFLYKKNQQFLVHPFKISGVWTWIKKTVLPNNNENKIEREEWILKDIGNGNIQGYYNRIVYRFSTNKDTYTCNGKTSAIINSFYKIKGHYNQNGELQIQEISYKTNKKDPCEPSGERYKDSFTGYIIGDTIQLKSKTEGVVQILKRQYGETMNINNKNRKP